MLVKYKKGFMKHNITNVLNLSFERYHWGNYRKLWLRESSESV